MNTLQGRLRLAMQRKPGAKPADLARACNKSSASVSDWLSGKIKTLKADSLRKAAEYLGCSAYWLETGLGSPEWRPTTSPPDAPSPARANDESAALAYAGTLSKLARIPVVGTAKMGDQGFFVELEHPVGSGDGFVAAYSSDTSAYAVRVRGDSMHPTIKHGQFVVVEPNHACVPSENVLLAFTDGRKMVKELVTERADAITVMSINGNERATYDRTAIEFMHPVVCVVSASKWHPD